MVIYFARHGETDWNITRQIQGSTDVLLNEKGLRQAKELADKLVKEAYDIDCVYTSPLIRARETAKMAANALGVACKQVSEFAEMDFGKWEGEIWANIEKQYTKEYEYWNRHRRYSSPPGGECYNDVLKRVFKALDFIIKQENGNVLVISHSAIIMSLRCYLAELCIDDDTMLQFLTKNIEIVEIEADDIKRAIRRFVAEEEQREKMAAESTVKDI